MGSPWLTTGSYSITTKPRAPWRFRYRDAYKKDQHIGKICLTFVNEFRRVELCICSVGKQANTQNILPTQMEVWVQRLDRDIQYESAWPHLGDPTSHQKLIFQETYWQIQRGRHLKVIFFCKIGTEWGRHGSPRANTQSQRSHGLQEGFLIPPWPPGHHIIFKRCLEVQKTGN